MSTKKNSNFFKRHQILILISIGLFFVILSSAGFAIDKSVQANNKKKAAFAAEQARLAADPVSISGIYTALNKERASTGAQALATLQNLTTAANQFCNDMVTSDYFDYTNPKTGKTANSFITDNAGGLYLKSYVSSIFSGYTDSQTSTDAVMEAVSKQATNLNSPNLNSVGWATCQSPSESNRTYIVGMFADKEEKPVAPTTVYRTTPVYTPSYSTPLYTPTITPPTMVHCNTTYNTYGGMLDPTASTTCY